MQKAYLRPEDCHGYGVCCILDSSMPHSSLEERSLPRYSLRPLGRIIRKCCKTFLRRVPDKLSKDMLQECESSSTRHPPGVNPLTFQTHSLEVTLDPPSFSDAMGPHCVMCTEVYANSSTVMLCSPVHSSWSSWRAGTPSHSPEHSRGPPQWLAMVSTLQSFADLQVKGTTPYSLRLCIGARALVPLG